jgi:hypothetical protein
LLPRYPALPQVLAKGWQRAVPRVDLRALIEPGLKGFRRADALWLDHTTH